MRLVLVVFILLQHIQAAAGCGYQLEVTMTDDALEDVKQHAISNDLLDAVVSDGLRLLQNQSDCLDEFGIVFHPYSIGGSTEDLGFFFDIRENGAGQRFLMSIRPSDVEEERDFFRQLADCEGLEPLSFTLRFAIKRIKTLEIPPSVQIKIREKHDLNLERVIEAFGNHLTEPQFSNKPGNRDVYTFFGRTNSGLKLRLVAKYLPGQRKWKLITAYRARY